jgi:acyl-CoA thioesterase YciA
MAKPTGRREETPGEPQGELAVRTLAMPADTNPAGDIFGGWIMSLMDVAGGITATRLTGGRVVTVAVTDMAFLRPVKVGDVVCCYTDLVRVGRTSLTLRIEAWVLRQRIPGDVTVAEYTVRRLSCLRGCRIGRSSGKCWEGRLA